MTKKRNRVPYVSKDTQIQKNVEKLDILAIDSLIKGLSVQRDIAIEKAMNSDDIVDIMKAQQYLEKNKAKSPELKSHVYMPEDFTYSGESFKKPITGMPFEVLQRMGSIPVVNSIIKTRINQVKLFLTFSSDVNKVGYTIKRKSSIFEDESKKNLSPKDKQTIEYIVNFLENGGKGGKWDDGDDLHDFVSKLLIDSLSMDQCAFEVVRDRKGDLFKHVAVDGSLIRQLDSNDPRYASQFEPLRVNGFLPKYAQIWNNQIVKTPNTNDSVIYYPWELGYGIRNRTSNVRTNGYGISELEVANEIVTYILWGFQYNGNFFKQGSNPKGFINIKNGNMNNSVLNEFRQSWRQMMSGVQNSHKLPIFEGVDLEWTDMQQSNKDMEFQQWTEFLIVVFCSVFSIDPSELGFHFKDQADMFGQQGQKERLDHSQKKGLEPLLKFLEKLFNKYIVSEIDPEFEFKFTGISIEDETAKVALDKAKLDAGVISQEDAFQKYSGRKCDPKKDTILNQVYQSAQNAKQMGGDVMNQVADEDEEGGDESNPFSQYEKSIESSPIMQESMKYFDQIFKK